MANRAAKVYCMRHGCSVLIESGTGGYCTTHRKTDDTRLNSYQRGYDSHWQQFRVIYLRDNPLCVDCQATGIITAANEIHHILKLCDYPKLKYEESNLKPLCKTCHQKRTAKGE